MKNKFLFLIFGACSVYSFGQVKIIDITTLGAKGDGITINTTNIQSAIDAVAASGSGKVIIPQGKFLTGSIILKTGVELHLDENATLLGSIDPYHYKGINRGDALILADGQKNISITGKGTIDGQGRKLILNIDTLFNIGKLDGKYYNNERKRPNWRPKIIEIDNCKNVQVTGVLLKNSGSWVQNYALCNNLIIDNIHVESDDYWNNDGLDISDCRNVRITNCDVNSSDDGICMKSEYPDKWNDSIYIADCTVRSSASAIKLGTGSKGGFRNIKIENIKVYDTFRSAIAIESVDGGTLENVEVNNIDATNTGNAIFIRLGHRNTAGEVGVLRNITIRNIKVQVPFGPPDQNYEIRGPELPYTFFHNPFPASITGISGHFVENVILENIEISYPGRGNEGMAIIPLYRLNDVPESESTYPEFSMFGELPSWGFYVRHVNGLTMKNVSVIARENDFRPAFIFDDANDVHLNLINISKANNKSPIILKNVNGAHIQNIRIPGFNGEFIQIIK
jgi:polygalacturonase